MENKKHKLDTVRIRSLLYIIIPALLFVFIMWFSYSLNVATIYGRYHYTGTDEMSFFGYLDLAHYRSLAGEEIWGWQFFFGNLPFLVVFALVIAGLFHMFHPKEIKINEEDDADTEKLETNIAKVDNKNRQSTKRIKIIAVVSFAVVIIITLLEIIASLVGADETGIGSRLYTGAFYRDIPTLITEGSYVLNNIPHYNQMFLSFIPVFAGFGIFPYLKCLRGWQKRNLIKKQTKSNLIGWIFSGIGILWLSIIIFSTDFGTYNGFILQSLFTGYTVLFMVLWILVGFISAGFVGLIQNTEINGNKTISSITDGQENIPNSSSIKDKMISIILFVISFILIFLSGMVFLFPHFEYLSMGDDITFAGIEVLQILFVFIDIVILLIWYRREKENPIIWKSYLFFFSGLIGAIYIVTFMIIKKDLGSIEIAWMYNAVLPMIFTVALTIFFYSLGQLLTPWIKNKLENKATSSSKNDTSSKNTNSSKNDDKNTISLSKSKTVAKIGILCYIIIISLFPASILTGVYGEKGQILVNNLGMLPDQEKTFFLATRYDHPDVSGTFQLFDVNTDKMVFEGPLVRKGFLWDRYHWWGNFSSYTTEGSYYITTKLGTNLKTESNQFDISSTYLDGALNLGLYWNYYARSGEKVVSVHEGYEGHEAGHLNDAWYLYNDTTYNRLVYINSSHTNMGLDLLTNKWVLTDKQNLGINMTGGWMDSGDYNVYGERMIPCNLALAYAFDELPNYYHEDAQRTGYPQNDSIPDIIEESWFGLQWWMKRWYETEQLYFSGNELGVDGSIRWTVFCPVENEEEFGNGRWVVGDRHAKNKYASQFKYGSDCLGIAGSFAALAQTCEKYGYYTENITQLKAFAIKTRDAYGSKLTNNFYSLKCEKEMYELTNNITYLNNAIDISNNFIERLGNSSTFPGYENVGFLLDFIKDYNGINGWNALAYLEGNQSINGLVKVLNSRTKDETNYFNFLRTSELGAPVIWNSQYMTAIFAASYAWNLTTNVTLKKDLYDFMTRHLDWIYGRNMENVCLMEGIPGGENNVYTYFTRYKYAPGNLRGIFPGFFADGFQYYPGDFGEKNDVSKRIVPQMSNVYREVWSDNAYAFQLASNAFYSQVLSRT
jgi:glycosyl hydrolase family 9/cellulase-like Ig domain-containing protein